MGQSYYPEDIATWNQAKAYQIRIDSLLRQCNFSSTVEMNYQQWANCLLALYREVIPYIEKEKEQDKIKNKRNEIIKILAKPKHTPQYSNQIWVVCDEFQQSIMVLMEKRGLLMPLPEDISLKI